MNDLHKYLDVAIAAVKEVRPLILDIYHTQFDVKMKEDNSPVTKADLTSDRVLRSFIHKSFPNHAILSEETTDDLSRLDNDYVWIIDPLDGTKDFVGRDDEFSVNVALSYKKEIILGVILVPITGEIFYAMKGHGSHVILNDKVKRIYVSSRTNDLTMVRSRYHFKEEEKLLIEKNKDLITNVVTIGSAIKACRIAEGKAEISYRSSPGTKEWDIAASQIILEEAGGYLLKPDGSKYLYNRINVNNLEGYVMISNKEFLKLL
jgi:3'(2'), 5'-bisphosphate nucleotidase